MTREEFDNLSAEEMAALPDDVVDEQLAGFPDDQIERKIHAIVARELLRHDILSRFSRRVTDTELLSPPFYDEARTRLGVLKAVVGGLIENKDLKGRFRRVGEANARWKEVQEIAGVAASLKLYFQLVTARERYDSQCRNRRLLTDHGAAQSAAALRARLRGEAADWHALTAELSRFVETQQNPPVATWALLPYQQRETGFRTYVIRLIADALKCYCPTPKIQLIADLATATLPHGVKVVDDHHVRTALRLDEGDLGFGREIRRKPKN